LDYRSTKVYDGPGLQLLLRYSTDFFTGLYIHTYEVSCTVLSLRQLLLATNE